MRRRSLFYLFIYFACITLYFFYFILFFNFTILYWFCHISTWIRHRYTHVPHPEPSSFLPPRTIPLGRPSAPAPSIQYRASNLDWRLVSYMILYFANFYMSRLTKATGFSNLLLHWTIAIYSVGWSIWRKPCFTQTCSWKRKDLADPLKGLGDLQGSSAHTNKCSSKWALTAGQPFHAWVSFL